jgi:hypothetical protein
MRKSCLHPPSSTTDEAVADNRVQFPGQPVDQDAHDLAEPLKQILIAI